jgi:hypothetical protein
VHAEALVLAGPEREVVLLRPVDVERLGVFVARLVAVRRPVITLIAAPAGSGSRRSVVAAINLTTSPAASLDDRGEQS